jgi:hypothetical protein
LFRYRKDGDARDQPGHDDLCNKAAIKAPAADCAGSAEAKKK